MASGVKSNPMEMPPPQGGKKRGAVLKALVLVLFIAGAIVLVRQTALGTYFTPERARGLIDAAGFWAPLVFILLYAAGVCLFVPATVLTGIGAFVFGPYLGFLWVWAGAMAGATAAFFIGRTLGRDLAASLIGNKLHRYDEAIARNGFATILYLRLIYFPFTPLNFGMGLTRIPFRDYFFGTALGIVVGTFVFTFFFGTLKDVLASGDWGLLVSPRVGFSAALFVFSFFIPKIIRKLRRPPDSGNEGSHSSL